MKKLSLVHNKLWKINRKREIFVWKIEEEKFEQKKLQKINFISVMVFGFFLCCISFCFAKSGGSYKYLKKKL